MTIPADILMRSKAWRDVLRPDLKGKPMTPTPGPWPKLEPVARRDGYGQWWLIEGVAEIHASEADARMMAAAADMLKALKAAHESGALEHYADSGALVRRAIAKAIGAA